ncbi:MAG: GntR family transcriptional regulator [Planctomycetota bacterium]
MIQKAIKQFHPQVSKTSPLHKQLYKHFASKIYSGELNEDEKLPPILEVADELAVGSKTVQRVYEDLKRDGLILASRGRGSFVAPVKKESLRSLRIENYINFGPYAEKLNEEFQYTSPGWELCDSSAGADVVQITSSNLSAMVNELENVTDLVKDEFAGSEDPCIKALKINNKHYFMPSLITPQVLYFKPHLIEKANLPDPREGWDYHMLLTAAEKLTTSDMSGFSFSLTGEEFLPYLWRAGVDFPCVEDPAVFISPEALHAAEFIRNLSRVSGAGKLYNAEEAVTPWRAFKDDKTALFISHTTGAKFMYEYDVPDNAWAAAPLPRGLKAAGLLTFYGHGILKHSDIDAGRSFLSSLGKLENIIKDEKHEQGSLALHKDIRETRQCSSTFIDSLSDSYTVGEFFSKQCWRSHIPTILGLMQMAFRKLVLSDEPVQAIMAHLSETLAALSSQDKFHEQFYFSSSGEKA